jgi:hypothetical protein
MIKHFYMLSQSFKSLSEDAMICWKQKPPVFFISLSNHGREKNPYIGKTRHVAPANNIIKISINLQEASVEEVHTKCVDIVLPWIEKYIRYKFIGNLRHENRKDGSSVSNFNGLFFLPFSFLTERVLLFLCKYNSVALCLLSWRSNVASLPPSGIKSSFGGETCKGLIDSGNGF